MANKSKDVKSVPMGINDDFSVKGVDFNNVIEREKFITKAAEKGVKIEALSTELSKNMTIKAQDDTIIDFEKRKEQLKTNPRYAKYLSRNKEQDIDRAM